MAMAAATASAQDQGRPLPYTPTLTYGTGLINIPTAWVSPTTGDLWGTLTSRAATENALTPGHLRSTRDQTFNLDAHLFGRVSIGASLYSVANQQMSLFARALLLRATDATPGWMPSVAIGVTGVGTSARQDRFLTGNARAVDALGASGAGKGRIGGAPSFYGVATKDLGSARTSVGLSAGFGTGLFRNDGGMGTDYNAHGGTGGAFGGIRVSHLVGEGHTQLSAMAEIDGWDVNAGVVASVRHWQFGIVATELDESGGTRSDGRLAGWTKLGVLFGYNGSIPDILRGTRQRAELTELDLEAQDLRREVAQRERRRLALERAIAAAQAGVDAAAASRQAALQKQLEAEREAIRKANERLDTVNKTGKPPEGR